MLARSRRSFAVVCLAAVSTACGAPRPPDVLLLVADTLRADRLGAYGGPPGLTPTLDRLAQHAQVYRRAYSTSSWTSPALASLFTSRFQSQHGVVAFTSVLGEREETLAEVLGRQGYATAGFSANVLVSPDLGYAQGFDIYRVLGRRNPKPRHALDRRIVARGRELNEAALEWLDALLDGPEPRPPFFLYLHYMEPHTPFQPDPGPLGRVLEGRPAPDFASTTDLHVNGRTRAPTPAQERDVEVLYDAEVASLDAALGELLQALEERGLLDDALVVFVADHGEELRDHGSSGHGHTLYEELLRVPLLVRPPGAAAGMQVNAPVSVVDVAPSIARFAGAPVPRVFQGRALPPAPGGDARLVLGELLEYPGKREVAHPERALVEGSAKLIVDSDQQARLFELDRDPDERAPVADPDRTARLRADLDGLLVELEAGASDRRNRPMDPQLREELEALGYLKPSEPAP